MSYDILAFVGRWPAQGVAARMHAMRFAFEMTQADYLEAAQALGRRRGDAFRPIRWWGLGTAAVGFVLMVGTVPHAARISSIALTASGLFMALFPIWVAYGQVEKNWEAHRPTHPTEIEVDERGISFSSPLMRGTWLWDGITEFQETRSLFMLFRRGDVLATIPKRGLKSAEELHEFRRMLCERVSSMSKGFPVVVAVREGPG
jgi:hypothetical protein